MARQAANWPRNYVSARPGKRSLIRPGFRWEMKSACQADSASPLLLGFCAGIVHALAAFPAEVLQY
jgi:hypothetical protein